LTANVLAAAVDGAAFAILIPFLNVLFERPEPVPQTLGWLTKLRNLPVGLAVGLGDKSAQLLGVIGVLLALVTTKNVIVWIGGQLGASLQERITRDLRDAGFRHMPRLPPGWFPKTKTGQHQARLRPEGVFRRAFEAELQLQRLSSLAAAVVLALNLPAQAACPVAEHLIDAYQARRALDYLVGYKLSPVLWRKLPGSRSAGRVQSVALRLICEREAEIEAFRAQEYWSVEALLRNGEGATFNARLVQPGGKKLDQLSLGDAGRAEGGVPAGRPSSKARPRRRRPANRWG